MDKTYVHFDVSLSFDRDLQISDISLIKGLLLKALTELSARSQGHFDDLDMSVNFDHIESK